MRNSDNKTDLINFILRDWSTTECHILIVEGKNMYMTTRDQAYCISSNQGTLSSSHIL